MPNQNENRSQILNAPRIMIAAPASGSGKTTLTCALLRLLQKRGKRPAAFKCGPDFIDPLFHKRVLGVPSTNLDSYFVGEGELRAIFAENVGRARADYRVKPDNDKADAGEHDGARANCAVIEGVMGLFDGLVGKSLRASSYDIARITNTPILLVVDAGGMGRSIVPLVQGFLDYDKKQSADGDTLIKGIFLNKCSKSQFDLLKPQIEAECVVIGENGENRVKVVGFLPKNSETVWKSRHLGLFLPSEIEDLNKQIDRTAEILSETLDFPALEEIMQTESCEKATFSFANEPSSHCLIGDFKGQSPLGEGVGGNVEAIVAEGETSPFPLFQFSTFNFPFRIAVARDEAFCFYYQENLRLLEDAGATLEYFSPLHDKSLPSGAAGLLIGGGYPELHAAELQANESMRESIRSAVKNGMPVMAECGGFMYLQERLIGGGMTMAGGLIPLRDCDLPDLHKPASPHRHYGFSYDMCDAIPGECFYMGKLVRFGYAEFTKKSGGQNGHAELERLHGCGRLVSESGFRNKFGMTTEAEPFSIKGHEFHYFDSTNNGTAFTAQKPLSSRSWDCMIHTPTMLAGFPHLYYRSNPEIVRWFVESCGRK